MVVRESIGEKNRIYAEKSGIIFQPNIPYRYSGILLEQGAGVTSNVFMHKRTEEKADSNERPRMNAGIRASRPNGLQAAQAMKIARAPSLHTVRVRG